MNIIRTFAVSVVSAGSLIGIFGGAAVGLAGTAGATTVGSDVRPPHVVATPGVKAHPAPEMAPGHHWHRGIYRQSVLSPYAR